MYKLSATWCVGASRHGTIDEGEERVENEDAELDTGVVEDIVEVLE